ncbi:MAG: P-loop NTPase [Victivallales bacterium]|nr:P-loop NTPase [Victivallales bacterium]
MREGDSPPDRNRCRIHFQGVGVSCKRLQRLIVRNWCWRRCKLQHGRHVLRKGYALQQKPQKSVRLSIIQQRIRSVTITVASGKGGTGKTTFSVNLAYALAMRGERVRLLDCDVEEPNDHLFVRPEFTVERPVKVPKPAWDAGKCIGCGKCAEACNYNAIAVVKGKVLIFNELCHSCGVCTYVCPQGALEEKDAVIGTVQAAPGHEPFYFAHGLLNIGEALAPNVVRSVKEHIDPDAINIIDASPGTACPVVEAVSGADVALLVTEPTPFGLNDLKLAVGLTLKLGVPTGIIVNRSDGEDKMIAEYAESVGLPISGRIPFKREYAEVYSDGNIIADHFPELRENLLDIFDTMATASPPQPKGDIFELAIGNTEPFSKGSSDGYKEITIISGKGGTGKTTIVGAFAHLADNKILADNDVDAADLHLLLEPTVREGHDFVGGTKATIDSTKCVSCGRCAAACHFNAIRHDGPANDRVGATYRIEPLACEGCGLCPMVCPFNAIQAQKNTTGRWYVSATGCGPMVHARLGIAEENSGRLVAQVRHKAALLAEELKQERIIGDGPPGTGCPVIASVSGADLVVIVTEPTVSGVHDMERVMKLAEHFQVPTVVVINKADLNTGQAKRIEEIAGAHGSRIVGRIPFDRTVNDALMAGKTVIEYGQCSAEEAIRSAWRKIKEASA